MRRYVSQEEWTGAPSCSTHIVYHIANGASSGSCSNPLIEGVNRRSFDTRDGSLLERRRRLPVIPMKQLELCCLKGMLIFMSP